MRRQPAGVTRSSVRHPPQRGVGLGRARRRGRPATRRSASCSCVGHDLGAAGSQAMPTSSTSAVGQPHERLDRQPLGLHRPLLLELARQRSRRVLADLDRAARAQRPAPGPRRDPRRRGGRRASGRRRRARRTATRASTSSASSARRSAQRAGCSSSSQRRRRPASKPPAARPGRRGSASRARAARRCAASAAAVGVGGRLATAPRASASCTCCGRPRTAGERCRGRSRAVASHSQWTRPPRRVRPSPQALGLGLRGRAAVPRRGARRPPPGSPRTSGFGDRRSPSGRCRSRTSSCRRRASSRRPTWPQICSTDAYDRAAHAYGKAYRDVVRAFRGRFDHPPDVVALPRDEAEVERVLDWCAERRRRR